MSDAERLAHHQTHSQPIMEGLREWIERQFRERRVEPNSTLGKSLQYWLNHWEGLTRFLSVAGAPLDNNLAEQALKRFVLFRKNSLFYKTQHGAGVGDIADERRRSYSRRRHTCACRWSSRSHGRRQSSSMWSRPIPIRRRPGSGWRHH
jgi:hypothetical protein